MGRISTYRLIDWMVVVQTKVNCNCPDPRCPAPKTRSGYHTSKALASAQPMVKSPLRKRP